MSTTDERHRERAVALMREVLGSSYSHLVVRRVCVEDDLVEGCTSVTCDVVDEHTQKQSHIAGKGAGVIDAFFHGMIERFAREYPSLTTIRFTRFTIDADIASKEGFAGTVATTVVTVEVANSEDQRFTFRDTSRSMIAASVKTCLFALAYFVNSERAFVAAYHALKDAQRRQRGDLVQRYTDIMATLVTNTSYSDVIAQVRSDPEIRPGTRH